MNRYKKFSAMKKIIKACYESWKSFYKLNFSAFSINSCSILYAR